MRRREFISLVGSAVAAWPTLPQAAPAGPPKRRIGAMLIYADNNPEGHRAREVFEKSLQRLGWKLGQNLEIDYRTGIGQPETARQAVADLLASKPDLIFANSVAATQAAKEATRDIPVVFNGVSEPVSLGFVASLSHPGGNITGFSNFEPSIGGKWIELLKAIAPQASHVEVMFNPNSTRIAAQFITAIQSAAPKFGLTSSEAVVQQSGDIGVAMERLGAQTGGALLTLPDTFLNLYSKQIVDLEMRWHLPAMHPFRYFVDEGSLMSYGPDLVEQFQQAAVYVDKVFRGEKPADLPVQQPTKFNFVINARAAKALGLDVPPALLATADEVIE